jgi:hypothetical protein
MKRFILGWAVVSLLTAALGCDSGKSQQTNSTTVPLPSGGMNRQTGGSIPPPPPPLPGR